MPLKDHIALELCSTWACNSIIEGCIKFTFGLFVANGKHSLYISTARVQKPWGS